MLTRPFRLFLVTALLAVALAGSVYYRHLNVPTPVRAPGTPSDLLGKPFPPLTGIALSGDTVRFPDVGKGQVAVLTVAFIQDGQDKIDSWVTPLEAYLTQTEGVVYYEVPLMPRYNAGIRYAANSGMRSGIPTEKHPNVVCYYGDQLPYFKAFGTQTTAEAYFIVLDRDGIVRFIQEGFAEEADRKRAQQVIQGLIQADYSPPNSMR